MFLKIQNLHWVEVACQLFTIPGVFDLRWCHALTPPIYAQTHYEYSWKHHAYWTDLFVLILVSSPPSSYGTSPYWLIWLQLMTGKHFSKQQIWQFCIMRTYLVVTCNELDYHMQNTITCELFQTPPLWEFTIQHCLPIFVPFLAPSFIPNHLWHSPMMHWHLHFLAFLPVHHPVLPSMLMTRGITTSEKHFL